MPAPFAIGLEFRSKRGALHLTKKLVTIYSGRVKERQTRRPLTVLPKANIVGFARTDLFVHPHLFYIGSRDDRDFYSAPRLCGGERCFETKRGSCRAPNTWTAFMQFGPRPQTGGNWIKQMAHAYSADDATIQCPRGERRVRELQGREDRRWLCEHCYPSRRGVYELLLTCRPTGERDMLSRIESEIGAAFLYTDATPYALSHWLRSGFQFRSDSSVPTEADADRAIGVEQVIKRCVPHLSKLPFASQCELLGAVAQRMQFQEAQPHRAAKAAYESLTTDNIRAISEMVQLSPSCWLVKDIRAVPMGPPTSLHAIHTIRVQNNRLKVEMSDGATKTFSNDAVKLACGPSFRDFGNTIRSSGQHVTNYRTHMVKKLNEVAERWLFLERHGKQSNFAFLRRLSSDVP